MGDVARSPQLTNKDGVLVIREHARDLEAAQQPKRPIGRKEVMLALFKNLWLDESGQDLTEYAVLLALIAIIVVVAINTLGPAISASFNNTASALSGAGS